MELGKPFPASETHGLVDKVDVLAEIPYMVRKLVNYVAGTKPYIYQTLNGATLALTLPGQEVVEVKGRCLRSILLSVVERDRCKMYIRFGFAT